MNQQYLDFIQNSQNIPQYDPRDNHQSIDHISLKQRKAKRSLYQLGLEEDNLFSIQLATPLIKKPRAACVNAWSNLDFDDVTKIRKQKLPQQPQTQKVTAVKPFGQKQTNIPYLKDLLLKLQSPGRLKAASLNKKVGYHGYLQDSIKNSYKSARISDTIKLKENWNLRQCQGRPSFLQPYSSLSCRLHNSQSKSRLRVVSSQNSKRGLQSIKQADLIKIIMEKKKKELSMKKKKVSPVKILNFKAKTPKIKPSIKQKFHLIQLLN